MKPYKTHRVASEARQGMAAAAAAGGGAGPGLGAAGAPAPAPGPILPAAGQPGGATAPTAATTPGDQAPDQEGQQEEDGKVRNPEQLSGSNENERNNRGASDSPTQPPKRKQQRARKRGRSEMERQRLGSPGADRESEDERDRDGTEGAMRELKDGPKGVQRRLDMAALSNDDGGLADSVVSQNSDEGEEDQEQKSDRNVRRRRNPVVFIPEVLVPKRIKLAKNNPPKFEDALWGSGWIPEGKRLGVGGYGVIYLYLRVDSNNRIVDRIVAKDAWVPLDQFTRFERWYGDPRKPEERVPIEIECVRIVDPNLVELC